LIQFYGVVFNACAQKPGSLGCHTALAKAVKEKDFFGNQNSVAKPKDPSWDCTVQRLKMHFGVD
jgi:hypothetical protein